ncbi:efflux RND transporter permease subunit [Magnetospira sp. QH-2]|uniref:efflux RND transporter permease subunit n=1 Tax=Magnetospira sp. (strain QH-2) TaxID=1288970 RepID=UPI0003E81ABC|nr:efflux RND transporter permease subunit [Magnetospira sp. QH-2]CCQ75189.1 putative AcrB/AcrD/AcrF family cation efflux protein [Magnetospira sp. QH-2]
MSDQEPKLGISGNITRAFITSPLTPLLLLASIAVGLIALAVLPREEEPQISVPVVDIIVNVDGLKAVDVVELVTKPLEDIVNGIDNVEHVYSESMDDFVMVSARFDVGTDEDVAIVRIHETIQAHLDTIPYGIPMPLIVGRGVNDVPIVVFTLSPEAKVADRWDDNALYNLAEELLPELVKVPDVGLTLIVGGRANQIRVEPDPELLSRHGLTLNQVVDKIRNANRSFQVGTLRSGGHSVPAVAGQTLQGVGDIGQLLITSRDGRPVYVKDVANVVVGAEPGEHRVWQIGKSETGGPVPAVSIALAKRAGANAVTVAQKLEERLESVKGRLIPPGVSVEVTRNYGETALEKADELLFHLALATVSIVILITLTIGWREGLVVMVVIPTTILLTLFAAHLMGFTINRVSLFALIFSIGILVDDAIVVVENIVRHCHMKKGDKTKTPIQIAVEGVAEVGNPTIIATLTIVAALLPMMFVSGLMGPYMSPIPANASAAMLFSFFIAVIVTPWLLMKVSGKTTQGKGRFRASMCKLLSPILRCSEKEVDDRLREEFDIFEPDSTSYDHLEHEGKLGAFYRRVARPVLEGRGRSKLLLAVTSVATIGVMVLFATKDVTVKLLPFDNKSEFQIVVDLPEGSALEDTERVLKAAAERIRDLPELVSIQAYAGTSAPFNFNGLVRHYYLREKPELGDLQVNLTAKHHRDRTSHDIALDVRQKLADLEVPEGTSVKVVEVPPGPPVLSTLLAEVYGPDAESRRAAAAKIRQAYEAVDFVVDVDDSFGAPTERLRFVIDQEALEFHGVSEQAVYDSLQVLLGGVTVGHSQRGRGADPIEIAVRLPKSDLYPSERLLATPLPAPGPAGDGGRIVELGDVVRIVREQASFPIFRRDGHFAEMIMGEPAGRFEAPVYGMFAVEDQVASMDWGSVGPPEFLYHGQPEDESKVSVLWDGEWEITYVTFRDMGAAFAVAIMAIYLLVVGQFGSFKVPLVILVPVPLTLIGIVIGHWLFNAPFTATSMIGFIALAGIIVRNSILLVDFINHQRETGIPLRQALIDAGATRFKPIFLTALAAMIGAAFILADPIFQGLAISMVFGLMSSTALTLLVIPAIYVWLRDDGRGFGEGEKDG